MTTCGVDLGATCPPTYLASGVGLSIDHTDGFASLWGSKFAPLLIATMAGQAIVISPTASTPTIATTSIAAATIPV